MKKKLITLVLALVLCFAMCPTVHATNGDLVITAILPGNMTVQFTSESVQVNTYGGGTSTAYFQHAKLPAGTNLSSVFTNFVYTGSALKINGTQVSTNNTNNPSKSYSQTTNFTQVTTIEVVYGSTSKLYYVSAYLPSYEVKMSFEYENARAFANLEGNTYGTSGMLESVSSDEKTAVAALVASMDSMCESMLPDLTAAEYKVLDGIEIEPLSYDASSNTPYAAMLDFADARDNFTFTGNSTYISALGVLNADSTGKRFDDDLNTYVGTGGWMYQVKRGGVTYTPEIGINGWKLIPGDEIIWRYTCDYGYDIGHPMW